MKRSVDSKPLSGSEREELIMLRPKMNTLKLGMK